MNVEIPHPKKMLSDKLWTATQLSDRADGAKIYVSMYFFFKFYKQELHFSKFKFEIQMQQQMQRERVNNERNSLGENSAESVSPVSSGAPATSRDLLNALAEQKLPTLLKQETPKTPRRSKCLTRSAIHINPANVFSLSPVLKSCSQVLSFPDSILF